MSKKDIVLVISDYHAPFNHPGALDFLNDLRKKWKPTKIISAGDEADMAAISFHPKDPMMMSAGDEYKAMIRELKLLYKLFPKVQVCISNHTARPFRVATNAGLPSLFIKSYGEFLQAPRGWSWHESILHKNVVYEHGEGLSGKDGAYKGMVQSRKSFVCGHLHSFAGVQYSKGPFNQTFAMNVGCLIDRDSIAFAYGKSIRSKPTLGSGIVVDGLDAHFIRMPE